MQLAISSETSRMSCSPCCSRQLQTEFSGLRALPLRQRLATAPCAAANSRSEKTKLRAAAAAAVETVQPVHPTFEPALPGAFIADNTRFVEEHRIRGYEVSPDQRANMITIANLLQEVAGNHAVGTWGRTDNGFANVPSLKDLAFVMTRLQIRMHTYPRWGDIVRIETYFHEEGRLAARRDWVVTDKATGKVLGVATSTWVMINMATRKICKVTDDTRLLLFRHTPPETRHSIPVEETKVKLQDLDVAPQVEGTKQVARRADMDMNGHINNVTYLAWALEGMSEEVYQGQHLYEMELDFKAECQAGNTVESSCASLGGTAANGSSGSSQGLSQFLHTLRRCDTPTSCIELVRARSTWKPKSS